MKKESFIQLVIGSIVLVVLIALITLMDIGFIALRQKWDLPICN